MSILFALMSSERTSIPCRDSEGAKGSFDFRGHVPASRGCFRGHIPASRGCLSPLKRGHDPGSQTSGVPPRYPTKDSWAAAGRGSPCTAYRNRYTPHPTRYTLHPATYTSHPTPYTLHPTPDEHACATSSGRKMHSFRRGVRTRPKGWP